MSRWHKAFCGRPDILVDTGTNIPRCRACNSMPQLDELIFEQSKTISPWSPPTEPPRGQWDLWWPPADPNTEPAVNNSPPQPCAMDPPSSPIYKEQLSKNEIRLLCLSKVESTESPIHVDMEKHDGEYCPEYETVSYTWGGEDDDTRRQVPVYVGPFWDVLLQTKNCVSMLHYVRSRRASHFIWVDAICINQEDPIDRAAQVSKMSFIYQNCRRVIVYLGNEEPHPKTYRPRQPLATIRIEQLELALRTRYFSRVWVIQELLLSPEALIPIKDVDYLVDNRTASVLEKRNPSWDWHHTSAPWLQHMTAGAPFSEDEIFRALKQTCSSKATDPRDKIYGVLGLLKQDNRRDLNQFSITPNYSISFLEAFVSLCNYYLSTTNNASLFLNAAKWPSISPYPSWVPDWRVPTIWDEETHMGYSDHKDLSKFTRVNDYIDTEVEAESSYQRLSNSRIPDNTVGYIMYARSINGWNHYPKSWTTVYCGFRKSILTDWWDDITAFPRTGGICLTMTHLLDITSHLQIIEDEICGSARTIHIQGSSAALYLCAQQFSLERVVKTVEECSQVSLFVLETDPSEECLLWFLRKEGSTYSLISCCRCYSLYLLAKVNIQTPFYEADRFTTRFKEMFYREGPDWERSKTGIPGLGVASHIMPLSLAQNVFNGLKLGFVNMGSLALNIGAWWKSKQGEDFCPSYVDYEQRLLMRLIFPCFRGGWHILKYRDVLPLYQAIIDDNGLGSEHFAKSYSIFATLHCSNYSPKIQDGMITFTYNQEQWDEWEKFVSEFVPSSIRYAARFFEFLRETEWEVLWQSRSDWEPYGYQKAVKPKGLRLPLVGGGKSSASTSLRISLRISLKFIVPTLACHKVYRSGDENFLDQLICLKAFAAMLERGLTVSDLLEGNFVMPECPNYVPGWWDSPAGELGLDGSIQRVTIL